MVQTTSFFLFPILVVKRNSYNYPKLCYNTYLNNSYYLGESRKDFTMKLLFIGDVVGSPGRDMIQEYLPKLKEKYRPHITVINGENAASGRGITEKIYRSFLEWGAQAVTMGNHTWDNRDIFNFIDEAKYLVRPANFPDGAPGEGMKFLKLNHHEIAIINLQARTFMPDLDCPFKKAEELVAEARKKTPIIFVDFHGEATSEKQAMGWLWMGRLQPLSVHTHTSRQPITVYYLQAPLTYQM